jgi:hypothetical protein
VESFNGRVRDELLNVEEFSCMAEARVVIGDWHDDYKQPATALCVQVASRPVGSAPLLARESSVAAALPRVAGRVNLERKPPLRTVYDDHRKLP